MTDSPATTCIDEAAILVAAQPGGADRLRARHRRRANGLCTGCGSAHVRWPCVQVIIADRADQVEVRNTEPMDTDRTGRA